MAYTKTWKVVNTVHPTRVHTSVVQFYSLCQNATESDNDVVQHLSNDLEYSCVKDATLSDDKTYVTQVYSWVSEAVYNQWNTARSALPTIDADLTITDV